MSYIDLIPENTKSSLAPEPVSALLAATMMNAQAWAKACNHLRSCPTCSGDIATFIERYRIRCLAGDKLAEVIRSSERDVLRACFAPSAPVQVS